MRYMILYNNGLTSRFSPRFFEGWPYRHPGRGANEELVIWTNSGETSWHIILYYILYDWIIDIANYSQLLYVYIYYTLYDYSQLSVHLASNHWLIAKLLKLTNQWWIHQSMNQWWVPEFTLKSWHDWWTNSA